MVMLQRPTPARKSTAWTHVPSQPLDAITALAVPNPGCPSQSRQYFCGLAALQVALLGGSPSLFRLANFTSRTLSTVDATKFNRAFIKVNAKYWCKDTARSCAKPMGELVVISILRKSYFCLFRLLHRGMHSGSVYRKQRESNQHLDLEHFRAHVANRAARKTQ